MSFQKTFPINKTINLYFLEQEVNQTVSIEGLALINLETLIVFTTYELNASEDAAIQAYIDNHDATLEEEPLPPELLAEEAMSGSFGTPSSENPFITESDPRMSPATITQDGLLSQTDKGSLNSAYSHISSTDNPHSVTKTQVGLGNVDNTSDADKPISSATQTALNGKISSSLIGAASGVASLGADGKVPTGQLPAMTGSVVSYYVETATTGTTTSTTDITYLTFTPDVSFPAGDYLVTANGIYSTSATLGRIIITLFKNSTEAAQMVAQYFQASNTSRFPYQLIAKLSLTSSDTLSISYRRSGATTTTVSLYTSKIYLQKL
jgi:hypothetical protein